MKAMEIFHPIFSAALVGNSIVVIMRYHGHDDDGDRRQSSQQSLALEYPMYGISKQSIDRNTSESFSSLTKVFQPVEGLLRMLD